MKRNEVAALAVIEANKEGSMHFFTFTYNNRTLPVRPFGAGFDKSDILRGRDINESTLDLWKRDGCSPFVSKPVSLTFTPSLFRQDLRLFIKRIRVRYLREFGSDLPLRYLAFGEYGSRSARPHYHLLAFGLTDSQARFVADAWSKDFGFSHCQPIPAFNKDGSSGFAAAASYVAKYISKGDFVPQFVRDGLAEKPRRISSIRFGYPSPDEVERLRRFFLQRICADHFPMFDRSRSLIESECFLLMVSPSLFLVVSKS